MQKQWLFVYTPPDTAMMTDSLMDFIPFYYLSVYLFEIIFM